LHKHKTRLSTDVACLRESFSGGACGCRTHRGPRRCLTLSSTSVNDDILALCCLLLLPPPPPPILPKTEVVLFLTEVLEQCTKPKREDQPWHVLGRVCSLRRRLSWMGAKVRWNLAPVTASAYALQVFLAPCPHLCTASFEEVPPGQSCMSQDDRRSREVP